MAGRVAPIFDRLEFAEYVFREYPKMLYAKGGKTQVVNSEAEETALEGDWFDTPKEASVVPNVIPKV